MTLFTKSLVSYFGGMGAYGFYRGYNGLYKKDFKKQDEFITNRIVAGFGGMFFQSLNVNLKEH